MDQGVGSSLAQARTSIRRERRDQIGPPWRDPWSLVPVAVLVACAVGLHWIAAPPPGPRTVLVLPLGLAAAVSGWVLYVRRGPTAGERTLTRAILAERRTARQLAAPLQGRHGCCSTPGSSRTPNTRVPFLAVGPSGVAVVSVLPPGPYLILTPTRVKAGDDELASGWLPTRMWEVRYLLQQLVVEPTRDLRFTGPVIPIAAIGHDKAAKIPTGWSADPPYSIDSYQIRTPAAVGQYLRYLPMTLSPQRVHQLVQLIDQRCPPDPHPG